MSSNKYSLGSSEMKECVCECLQQLYPYAPNWKHPRRLSTLEGMDSLWRTHTLEQEHTIDSFNTREALKCFL